MKRHRISVAGAVVCLSFLFLIDTALAQNTITVSPTTLTFSSVPTGSLSPSQQLQVTTPNATTIVIGTNEPWLAVNSGQVSFNTEGGTPFSLPVQVNAGLLAPGSTPYSGVITLTINGIPASQQMVTVSATVTSGSALSASPATLSFTAQQGDSVGNPASATVQIASSAGTLGYTSGVSTQSGGNWLLLTNGSGNSGGNGITVSVNPSGLQPGTYLGTVKVQSSTTSDTVQIGVTLTVTASGTLTVTPATLAPFLFQIGQAAPATQQLMLTASSGSVNFSVSMNPAAGWLVPSPSSGTAGTTATPVTLSANPSGLQAGVYSTSLTITPSQGNAPPPIKVTLVVGNNPLLQLSASSLSYSGQFSGGAPPDQQVQVGTTSGSGSVGFTISSDSSWLSASTPNTPAATPATLTVHVNTVNLAVGSYTGNITLTPTNGDQYTESIAVSLTVSNLSTMIAGPPALLFSFETTQLPPQSQLVQLTSLGQPTAFTVSSATGGSCGSNWLSAASSASTTPATLTVSVNTAGLIAGVCSGTVTVSYNSGAGAATVAIQVIVQVATTPLLNVGFSQTPNGFGLEIVQQGAATINRTISLTSTDPNTPTSYAASATSSGPTSWLFVAPNASQTPRTLSVQISPSGLPPGNYTGSITLSPGTSNPASLLANLTIPITLVVNPNVTVSVTPAGPLAFSIAQNGPVPAAQTLTLASSGGNTATYTATVTPVTGGPNAFVQVTPASGQASGQVSVSLVPSVASSLTPGQYTNQIAFTYQNSSSPALTMNVNLTVTPPQTVSVSAQSLTYNYQLGSGTLPQPQSLQITSTGGPVAVTVGTTSSGWLSVTPSGGNTPLTLSVQANPAGLTTAGTLTGTIAVSAPGVLANPIAVNVTLTLVSIPPPQISTVTSNASNQAGAISPGDMITLKGTSLGPATGALFTENSQGGVNSTLSGVQVLFDNIPGTPYYVSATQINVTAPYEIAGRLSTNITVTYQGQQSAAIQQTVAGVAPGIFTLNTTGQGQAAVINQDGTVNGPSGGVSVSGGAISTSPAPQGSVIAVYATGGGQTNPPSATGSVAPTNTLLNLPISVTATIGGQPATVTFAGSAPGLITGVIQVNVKVPTGVTGSNQQLVLNFNGTSTPLGTTIAVQ